MQSAKGKFVYFFGSDLNKNNLTEGDAAAKNLLGGKGANLAEMAKLGLPVPPGFTISTEACTQFYADGKKIPEPVKTETLAALKRLEAATGKEFGSSTNPLLVSVRSGARASMPGMMDTILNLGLNDQSVEALAKKSGDARFAYDSYRRFIQMYADVVLGLHTSHFEADLEDLKARRKVHKDSELTAEDLKSLCQGFKSKILIEASRQFPQDPQEQLWGAVSAVFESWMSPRAIHYRKMERIPVEWGTAVNIQLMVFGNRGPTSATGVGFTRDPSNGQKRFFGEYLENAQGEDVVAGIRTPHPISKAQRDRDPMAKNHPTLEETLPQAFQELMSFQDRLEKHYKNMQDIEFTIEEGRLYLLQTRNAKRTTQAAVKVAIDMVQEGLITKNEAILRIDPYGLDQLLHPRLDPNKKTLSVAKGLPASPGAASGRVVFFSLEAAEKKEKGERVILVRHETSPEDIQGMDASVGILTALGGMTSHAAVVARGMGKPCIVGCGDLRIDYKNRVLSAERNGNKTTIKEGDLVTIDANTGEVYLGEIPTISSTLDQDFQTLMSWADQVRTIKVRANADTPQDARTARQFGAEGIGLCRTEHMFFEPDRIDAVSAMILADTAEERRAALDTILPMQRGDFVALFREMKGLPVNIRLLDPPLHEFLPNKDTDIAALAAKLKSSPERLLMKAHSLHELNPMLGHRGCRLGISFPEIYEMQARAIFEAIQEAARLTGESVEAEVMIPLVMEARELEQLRARVAKIADDVLGATSMLRKKVQIGTMIEIPRAALLADQIALHADFFSFGTNDLTQMTLGISRDDCGRFLPEYVDNGLLPADPFSTLDVPGVGSLVKLAIEKGRKTKGSLKTGVCGEHGGDPKSVEFFVSAGVDYVSCSPFRVCAARLAAAHARLKT